MQTAIINTFFFLILVLSKPMKKAQRH